MIGLGSESQRDTDSVSWNGGMAIGGATSGTGGGDVVELAGGDGAADLRRSHRGGAAEAAADLGLGERHRGHAAPLQQLPRRAVGVEHGARLAEGVVHGVRSVAGRDRILSPLGG